MKHKIRWFVMLALCLVPLLLSACGGQIPVTAEENKHVIVEHLDNAMAPTRETLTEEAANRLDIQTAAVMDGGKIVPAAALIYDNEGNTWIYTSPEPLTYVRNRIMVDRIQGDQVYLSRSLPENTMVVTVGVAELYGSEVEFEEE